MSQRADARASGAESAGGAGTSDGTAMLPRVAITMGDAAGIGPEIIVRALADPEVGRACRPVVLGDLRVLRRAMALTAADLDLHRIQGEGIERVGVEGIEAETLAGRSERIFERAGIACIDFADVEVETLRPGVVAAANGAAAVRYTRAAARLALAGRVDAIVSAPLNKAAMHAAGLRYEGHTEILAEEAGARQCAMVLLVGPMRIMLLTNHVSLREACDLVTSERVLERLRLADAGLRWLGIGRPRIAVAGLNPHAGEEGIFGREEQDAIVPAIRAARAQGIDVVGPFPADTLFVKARDGAFDLTLALHHDQGLLPAKLLGFGRMVTVLFGLPFVRTSVGHGTAYDIAWTGCADHGNMVEAIRVASELAGHAVRVPASGAGL